MFSRLFWAALCLGVTYQFTLTFSINVRCYKSSVDDYEERPLNESVSLLQTDCFNPNNCTKFYFYGYQGKADGPESLAIITNFINALDCNVFLVDWFKSYTNSTILKVLTYAESATVEVPSVGKDCAKVLDDMSDNGLDLNKTHILGMSLGAHIAGYIGRLLQEKGKLVDRITGLDAAGPLYQKPTLLTPLNKKDARFVDCVHTDPGKNGIIDANCGVDIYVRRNSDGVQSGCPVGFFEPLTRPAICSHARSVYLQIDGTTHPGTLIGCFATSYSEWLAGNCDPENRAYIGENVNRSAQGKYYINVTNPESIYGQGEQGLYP